MAWSSAFIAALASGRYAPRYQLVCLADMFGRASRGELGSEPGTVADADLVIDRVAPVLSGDGLDLPTAKATTGAWTMTIAAANVSRALQYLRPGTICELRLTLDGVEEPVALGMVETLSGGSERAGLEVQLTGIGDVLRSRWAVAPQRLFATIRDETALGAVYAAGDTTVTVSSTALWTGSAPYFLRLTAKDGSTFVLSASGKAAGSFTGVSTSAIWGGTAADCCNGARVERMTGAILSSAFTPGDTTVSVGATAAWADRDTLGLWAWRMYPTSGDPFILTCRSTAGGARGTAAWTSCDTSARLGGEAAACSTGSAIEPVIFLFNDPVEIALSVLLSTGTASSGFDVLPAAWGLAIPQAQVDFVESRKIISWIAPSSGGQALELLVDEGDAGVEDALAWLESFLSLRGIFITQRHGQVCLRALFAPNRKTGGPGVVATLDERDVSRDLPVTWMSSPDGVHERLRVAAADAAGAFEPGTASSARPGLGVAALDLSGVLWANSAAVIAETGPRLGGYYYRGYTELSLAVVGWSAWALCPGDRVTIDLPNVPFPPGSAGRSSLSNRLGVITQVDPDASAADVAITFRIYED
jgi:hypothetical protein